MSRMTTAIPSAALLASRPSFLHAVDDRNARIIGLVVVAILPAIFWTIAISAGAAIAHATLTSVKIATVGGSIALFLAAVCAPIMLRTR